LAGFTAQAATAGRLARRRAEYHDRIAVGLYQKAVQEPFAAGMDLQSLAGAEPRSRQRAVQIARHLDRAIALIRAAVHRGGPEPRQPNQRARAPDAGLPAGVRVLLKSNVRGGAWVAYTLFRSALRIGGRTVGDVAPDHGDAHTTTGAPETTMTRRPVAAAPPCPPQPQGTVVHQAAYPAQPLRIWVDAADHWAVVTLTGELDIAGTGRLSEQLAVLLSQGRSRIVLDLQGLTFCDAAGLGILVRFRSRTLQEGGWLRLAGPSALLTRLLRLARVAHLFAAFATVTAATTDLATRPGSALVRLGDG
jgi:anti-sigma B factor antagonist